MNRMTLTHFFKGLFLVIILGFVIFYGKHTAEIITSMGDASMKNINALKGTGGGA
ncbi:MAG: hypothetical protein FWD39_01995 [Clostridiales bacterium]|nr:hypothetical protein [Clostridiales bacterium]